LQEFAKEKRAALTPVAVAEVIGKREEFLAAYGKAFKPEELGDSKLTGAINIAINHAIRDKEAGHLGKLEKLLTVRIAKNKIDPGEVTNILRRQPSTDAALKAATEHYQSFVLKDLKICLSAIDKGTSYRIGDKSFSCPVKFLSGVLEKHKDNEFFPRAHIIKIQDNIAQKQNERQISKSIDLDI
jgi:hypothetical protein